MPIVGTEMTARAAKAEFFARFDGATSYFNDLSTRIASATQSETYAFLGTVPPMRQWGTGRKARGLYEESYNVENERYEISIEVDRCELDDDQLGQIKARIGEMALRAATHKDAAISDLLVNGGSSGYVAYDGKTFFANDHESGLSGVQDNTMAPSATDADNPTVAEFRTALGQAIARLLQLKDDHAEPMAVDASGLIAIVPPTMYITALEAVNATVVASTTNVLQGAARVIAFPRLTNASMWYLLKTNVPVRPFIFQDRDPIEFKALEQDSETGFLREKYIYGVRARYRLTYGYWQYALQCDFA